MLSQKKLVKVLRILDYLHLLWVLVIRVKRYICLSMGPNFTGSTSPSHNSQKATKSMCLSVVQHRLLERFLHCSSGQVPGVGLDPASLVLAVDLCCYLPGSKQNKTHPTNILLVFYSSSTHSNNPCESPTRGATFCNRLWPLTFSAAVAHGSEVEHAIRGAAIGGFIEVFEGQLQVPRLPVKLAVSMKVAWWWNQDLQNNSHVVPIYIYIYIYIYIIIYHI